MGRRQCLGNLNKVTQEIKLGDQKYEPIVLENMWNGMVGAQWAEEKADMGINIISGLR